MESIDSQFISIVIPSYNSFSTIKTTIENILNQEKSDSILEILVVDSSDDEKTKGLLREISSPLLKVITSGIRVMPGTQRNIGAQNANGKLLVFIDSDAYPAPGWLAGIKEVYSKGYKVGGGSYLIEDKQAKTKHILAQYYFEFGEFIPAGKIRSKKMVPSCNLFCDRDLFLEIKGFPTIRASEDTLFCLYVNQVNQVYFFPDISVYHIFRDNEKKSLLNQKLIGKFHIIYRKMHNPRIYGKKINLIILFPLILIYKFCYTYFRTLVYDPVHFFRQNKANFDYLKCLYWWTLGVVEGIFTDIQD